MRSIYDPSSWRMPRLIASPICSCSSCMASRVTDVQPRLNQVAEFEQADAEAIGAGIVALDDAREAVMAARMRWAVDGCRPVACARFLSATGSG